MSKRQLLLILCISTLTLGALAFGSRAQGNSDQVQAARVEPAPQVPEPPAHVPYMFLFGRHAHFKKEADKLERQNAGKQKEVAALRTALKQEADLNDWQARSFDEISAECARKVAVKDKQAKEIIAAFSAQYPDGKLPDNMELLPPPVELGVLQQERDAIILEARDRLHAALGDNEFARFDKFVKEKVAPNVRLTGSGELRPKGVR